MSLELNAKATALVLIDLQKGILGMPLAPHEVQTVIANSYKLGTALAAKGGTIVLVHVGFSDGMADRLIQPVDAPNTVPTGGYPADWTDFDPTIDALRKDVVITKRQWGAFHGTELDLQLRRRGVTTIVLGGVSTNFGVESTAREAWQHNYSVVIAEDACASGVGEMHAFAVTRIFPRISRVRSTGDILAALS